MLLTPTVSGHRTTDLPLFNFATARPLHWLGVCAELGIDTVITLLAAGLIFLLALGLGVWKYQQMATSDNHLAHPYVDIAHRAALLYSFATLLLATFVALSAWPTWVNLTAAMVVVFFFVAAIASYIAHGARRDTTNQFQHPNFGLHAGMVLLIVGEMGGFAVLLAGFVAAQLG
jgi:heme/copper-type cytochrome/quinol oxidase subunit 2